MKKENLKPLELSKCDWIEIACALSTKAGQIENGDFGGEEHASTPM